MTSEKEIYLAGGCFWGAQKYVAGIQGVLRATVGYANGKTENPTYEQVCHEHTGHAETVRVVYDSRRISLRFLLALFFDAIDPTSLNRQGPDVGEQYRSGVYYIEETDCPAIEAALDELAKRLDKPVAVTCEPLRNFYPAEEYHQDYLKKHPGGYCHISDALCRAAAKARPYERPDRETLRKKLTPLQYRVTQESATEAPFDNAYDDLFEPGLYVDVTTGAPLFLSTDKFNSGCGWPAFSKPAEAEAVTEHMDTTLSRLRTEVRSSAGDAHLGHVFPDGPAERGGLRYCINSAALRFIPLEDLEREGYGAWSERVREAMKPNQKA